MSWNPAQTFGTSFVITTPSEHLKAFQQCIKSAWRMALLSSASGALQLVCQDTLSPLCLSAGGPYFWLIPNIWLLRGLYRQKWLKCFEPRWMSHWDVLVKQMWCWWLWMFFFFFSFLQWQTWRSHINTALAMCVVAVTSHNCSETRQTSWQPS